MQTTPRESYRLFKKDVLQTCDEHSRRDERYLNQVEADLGKPIIEALTASEIDKAITSAASKRKTVNNGGHQDDGANMRFRLGQAVVCFLRWAFSERIVDRNVYQKNNHRRPPNRTPNFQDLEKLEAIKDASDELTLKDEVIISLLKDTGMRSSELVRIRVCEINFKTLEIDSYMTKVKRWKRPVFTEATKSLILQWLASKQWKRKNSEYLLPGRGLNSGSAPLTTSALRERLQKIGRITGLRTNAHSFRHSVGAIWIGHGAPETAVMEQLGLHDTKMLPVYVHLSGKHLRATQKDVYQKAGIEV